MRDLRYNHFTINAVTRFSMTAPLLHVLVAHAQHAFRSQVYLNEHWREFGYSIRPNYDAACRESDAFISILESHGVQVSVLPAEYCTDLDSLYVHDPVVTLPVGFALCKMGKTLRQGEPDAIGEWLQSENLSIAGRISGPGKLEGGDVVWLKPNLALVGIGYRSNLEGIAQLRSFIDNTSMRIEPVFLPHWNGPGDVLHLMSMISPVGESELLVYSRIMPVVTRERLIDEGFTLIEIAEDEYNSMACNVLSLGNRICLIEKQNVKTADILQTHGFTVLFYDGSNISRPGEGGPTCLTRPILRD